jgi:hypothetical protein
LGRIVGASFESLGIGTKVTFASAKLMDGKPYWEFAPTDRKHT